MSVTVLPGDCIASMQAMPANSVDSCVTDPPYHLTSIVKRFGAENAAEAKSNGATGVYKRASSGFMGKTWDGGDIAFRPETWAEVLRVLKPGGHLVAFGAPKNVHRLTCAIAGGAPDVLAPATAEAAHWRGWGTALKPAFESIMLARKPLSEGTVATNVLRWRTGALNIDGCRIEAADGDSNARVYTAKRIAPGATQNATGERHLEGVTYSGQSKEGRWPANVIHDGSDEVLAAFPDAPGQIADASTSPNRRKTQNVYGAMKAGNGREGEASADKRYTGEGSTNFALLPGRRRGDTGSAARFFYCAKASKKDRAGSKHPTVKPIKLMRWLVRLVTPPGGTVLDPFAGSGTTGVAAEAEGFGAILCEREAEYLADIRRRLGIEADPVEAMLA